MSSPETHSEDAFLGGRLRICQPRRGHRAGLEAVLLAAACPAASGDTILDLGAGVGVGALCALARIADTRAILIEQDGALADLAARNAATNDLAGRVRVIAATIGRPGGATALGLGHAVDHAIANPPFREAGRVEVAAERAAAHVAGRQELEPWARLAAGALRAGGSFTVIFEAAGLFAVLQALAPRFGDLVVLPIHPRPGRPALRVIVQGRRGRRGSLTLLPGLVLHPAEGSGFTNPVERILRHGEALMLSRAP